MEGQADGRASTQFVNGVQPHVDVRRAGAVVDRCRAKETEAA